MAGLLFLVLTGTDAGFVPFDRIAYNVKACSRPSFWRWTMFRMFALLAAAVIVALALDSTAAAQARWISRGNPGQFGNIHGITYRSMQWEKDHGNGRSLFSSGRRFSWRRR
jgi:hypothetical protein